MLEFFHYTLGWLRYSKISAVQMAVGKYFNIRAIQGHNGKLPNIKYNCVVLFFSQLYLLFIYASINFLIDNHCKTQTEFSDLLAKGKIY